MILNQVKRAEGDSVCLLIIILEPIIVRANFHEFNRNKRSFIVHIIPLV